MIIIDVKIKTKRLWLIKYRKLWRFNEIKFVDKMKLIIIGQLTTHKKISSASIRPLPTNPFQFSIIFVLVFLISQKKKKKKKNKLLIFYFQILTNPKNK